LERGDGGAVLVEYLDGTASTLVEEGGDVDFVAIGTDGKFGLGWWALLLELTALVLLLVFVEEIGCVFIIGVNLCELDGKVFGRQCFRSTPETIASSEMTRGFCAGYHADGI
jgi:hypothetical protein